MEEKRNYYDVEHFDDRSLYDDQKITKWAFGLDNAKDINIYDTKAVYSEIITLINRAYRKGIYNGKQMREEELRSEGKLIERAKVVDKLCEKCIWYDEDNRYCNVYDLDLDILTSDIDACASYEDPYEPKATKQEHKCDDCVFRKYDTTDHKFKCMYYNNIPIATGSNADIYCTNNISKEEICGMTKIDLQEFYTMIEAFNYFKMDGGCDCCGSQRCPANARMILDGKYCSAFKKWCNGED